MTVESSTEHQALRSLRSVVRGDVITAESPEYDDERSVWNGMIDKRPLAIVRCAGTGDVVASLDAANAIGCPLTVRSGGHGVAGRSVCDGGLVVDLGSIRHVQVDPAAKTARVGPGATWSDVDRETTAFGLATTGGVHSGTGVGGLALGGGMGYLARRFGMTVDNILAAEVVLADGRVVTADADHHPDLYWALRGGGGNFGVVTELTLRLHEVGPTVTTTQAYWSADRVGEVMRWYRDFQTGADDDIAVLLVMIVCPPADPFPSEFHGTPIVGLVGCFSGDVADGEAVLRPIQELDGAFLSFTMPIDYADLQCMFDAGSPTGARYYWKSHYLGDLDDDVIDAVAELAVPLPGPYTNLFVEPLGGAISRVPADAMAYPHRDARFGIGFTAGWDDPADDETALAWARGLHARTAPSAVGVYTNYLDRDDLDRVGATHGINLERLQQVKAIYDPGDRFSAHGHVPPV